MQLLLADVLCVPNNVSADTAGVDDIINSHAITGLGHLLNAVKGMSGQLSAISGLEGVPKQLVTGFAANLTRLEADLSQRSANTANLAGKAYSDVGVLIDYSLVTENELNRELLLQSSALGATNADPSGQNPLTVALQLVAQTRRQLVDSLKRIHNSLESRANTDERFKPVAQEFANMFKTIDRQTAKTQHSGRQEVVDQLSKVEEWIGKATGDQAKEAQQIKSQLSRRLADIDRQIVSTGSHGANGNANGKPSTGLFGHLADMFNTVKSIAKDIGGQMSAIVGLEGAPKQLAKELVDNINELESQLTRMDGKGNFTTMVDAYKKVGSSLETMFATEHQLNRQLLSESLFLAKHTDQSPAAVARQLITRNRNQLEDSLKRVYESLVNRVKTTDRLEQELKGFENDIQNGLKLLNNFKLKTLQSDRQEVVNSLNKVENIIRTATADQVKDGQRIKSQLI
ncbi:unnamed protein product, partial [Medioppia subpectinata]